MAFAIIGLAMQKCIMGDLGENTTNSATRWPNVFDLFRKRLCQLTKQNQLVENEKTWLTISKDFSLLAMIQGALLNKCMKSVPFSDKNLKWTFIIEMSTWDSLHQVRRVFYGSLVWVLKHLLRRSFLILYKYFLILFTKGPTGHRHLVKWLCNERDMS